jgi:hypothetical protein
MTKRRVFLAFVSNFVIGHSNLNRSSRFHSSFAAYPSNGNPTSLTGDDLAIGCGIAIPFAHTAA